MDRTELRALLLATGCAVQRGEFIFLCDPNASPTERAAMEREIGSADPAAINPSTGWFAMRTGGTGGTVRLARHDESTVMAAVSGFSAHFGIKRVNAIDVLPAHHVSGLMARIRCAATAGRHVAWDWKELERGAVPTLPGDDWILSLVPTQLQRLLPLPEAVAWLRSLRIVFLGGGPTWPELADRAREMGLRISLTYGMTETAAMIAALQPEEFLRGARSCGAVMPHARVEIDPTDGTISVAGDSVFRGYWPGSSATPTFVTQDMGRIDDRGHLHVLGRRDALIITGGKKVNLSDVEAELRRSGEFADVAVIGVPDGEWGEMVVACYPHGDRQPDTSRAVATLPSHERPKRFIAIDPWPRNAQGKLNRAVLREAALQAG